MTLRYNLPTGNYFEEKAGVLWFHGGSRHELAREILRL